MSEQSDDDLDFGTMFPEPARPATPPPTLHTYTSPLLPTLLHTSPDTQITLTIQLVGSNPLWGHVLWNASVSLADYLLRLESIESGSVRGAKVLELGAGGGLPSLVAACAGAREVVVTDYPEESLLDNLRWNVTENTRALRAAGAAVDLSGVSVEGHLWGKETASLGDGYDILILSDLIFNHSQHTALLLSAERLIAPTGRAYVFHSHHLPQFYLRDLGFFMLAARRGWVVKRVVREHRGVMFAEDEGDVGKRGTVWGWEMSFVGVGGGSWDPEEHSEGLRDIIKDSV